MRKFQLSPYYQITLSALSAFIYNLEFMKLKKMTKGTHKIHVNPLISQQVTFSSSRLSGMILRFVLPKALSFKYFSEICNLPTNGKRWMIFFEFYLMFVGESLSPLSWF